MALYGLSVFLETAQHLRKGRRRYIATSFTITMLAALSASIDVALYFQVLLQSSSGRRLIQIMQSSEGEWERTLSIAAMGCILLVADTLLVRSFIIAVG
jgi:hypothetical protein